MDVFVVDFTLDATSLTSSDSLMEKTIFAPPNSNVEPSLTAQADFGFFGCAKTGQLPLWKAFWLLFVPTPFVLSLAYIGILWAWVRLGPPVDPLAIALPFTLVAFLLLLLAGLAVWRCSKNTSSKVWRYLALVAVAVFILWYGRRVAFIWLVFGPYGI